MANKPDLSHVILLMILVLITYTPFLKAYSNQLEDPQYIEYQLQWDVVSPFLNKWIKSKKTTDNTLKKLLNSHNKLSKHDLELIIEKNEESRARTLSLLNITMQAIDKKEYELAKNVISKNDTDMTAEEIDVNIFLESIIASNEKNYTHAETLLTKIHLHSNIYPLAQLNLVLINIQIGNYKKSLSIINEIQGLRQFASINKQAKNYLVLLQALSLGLSGDLDKANKLILKFTVKHPLYRESRVIKSEILIKNNKLESALLPLMQLEKMHNDFEVINYPGINYPRINIINSLMALKSDRQATRLREHYISEILKQLKSNYAISNRLRSNSLLKTLMARKSGNKENTLINNLDGNSKKLLDEIERNNTLRNMLQLSYKDILAYNIILNKGRKYWVKKLEKYANKKKNKKNIALNTSVSILETLLTELVGTPKYDGLRYQLLDGLSIWVNGREFKDRWWLKNTTAVNIETNLSDAQDELRYLLAIPRKKRRSLLDAHMNVLAKKMKLMPSEITKSLASLKFQKPLLRKQLKISLNKYADKLLLKNESELLWLVKNNLPVKDDLVEKKIQYRYYIKQYINKAGIKYEKLVKIKNPASKAALKQTIKALNFLAYKARSIEIKQKSMFILANVQVDMIQRAGRNYNPYPVKGSLVKATKLYSKLLRQKNSEIERSDILYQIARVYDLSGYLEMSLKCLNSLSDEYPQYSLIEEVRFRRAELYFSFNKYDKASKIYQKLLTNKTSKFYDKSLYKIGWAYYKQMHYKKSIDVFMALIKKNGINSKVKSNALIQDILAVTAMAFSNLNGINSVKGYFLSESDKHYQKVVLLELAKYYQQKSRYSDAANAFAEIIKLYPDDIDLHYYHFQIINSYASGGFNSKVWQSRQDYIEKYGGNSDYWNKADTQQKNRIRHYLKNYLSKLAQRDHARAQLTGKKQDYLKAIVWYEKYVRDIADDKQIPEMYFLMAEARQKINQYDAAIKAFEAAAYGYPSYIRREAAAYSALFVYQSKITNRLANHNKNLLEKELILGKRYLSEFGSSKNAIAVHTKMAENYLLLGKPVLAVKESTKLIEANFPLSQKLLLANWRVIAHASFSQANYKQAEAGFRAILKLKPTVEEKTSSTQFLAESIYKQAKQDQKQGRLALAITRFKSIGVLALTTDVQAKAEFDIATSQILLKQWANAITTLGDFEHRFPTHSLNNEILEKWVVAYEGVKNWPKAAYYLKQIYNRERGSVLGRDALWRSAMLYKKSGDYRKSYNIFKDFIKIFPAPLEDALEAKEQLVLITLKMGETDKRIFWLKDIIKSHDKNMSDKTDRTLFLASKSSLALAIDKKKRLDHVVIALPLTRSLKKKQKIMRSTLKYLNKTISYQLSEHSTRATLLIAEIYRNLAVDIANSPRPKNLNSIEMSQYEILLEDQVIPFEDKAIDFYELNMGQIKNGIYTASIKQSILALRKLMPARYLKQEKVASYYEAIQ